MSLELLKPNETLSSHGLTALSYTLSAKSQLAMEACRLRKKLTSPRLRTSADRSYDPSCDDSELLTVESQPFVHDPRVSLCPPK